MRLIDADALMQTLGITDMDCGKCDLHGTMGCSKKGGFVDACVAIEHAPTIEERKKGKWSPHPNKEFREWDVCSSCGIGCKRREYGIEENGQEWVTEYNYPYCPNCGARMEEHE